MFQKEFCFFISSFSFLLVYSLQWKILFLQLYSLKAHIRILSLNLAISDMFTASGLFLTLTNEILHGNVKCDIKKYPTFMLINVSLLITTMMNLDCCFASAFAMRYYSFITKKLIERMCYDLDLQLPTKIWNVFFLDTTIL